MILNNEHMEDTTENYIRLCKDRSDSNIAAIHSLFVQQLYGQAVALLWQELDSLVRVCHLLTISDFSKREKFMNLAGKRWKKGGNQITDSSLVDVANRYNSWARDVYDFGNKFTHLSDYHAYKSLDPLATLDISKKVCIEQYLTSYHQYPGGLPITLEHVIPYLPKVADKVVTNLSSYLKDLKERRDL